MRDMVYFELKKMFGLKKSLISAVSVIILCIIIFLGHALQNNLFESLSTIKKGLTEVAGEVTPERYDAAEKRYYEIIENEENFIITGENKALKPELQQETDSLYLILYSDPSRDVKDSISTLEKELIKPDTSPNQKILIKRHIEMLKARGNNIIGYNLFYAYYEGFSKNFAPYILGFLIIFFVSSIFTSEYVTKMDSLILSSRHGKRKLIFSKFLAVLVGVTAIFTLVCGTYIVICGSVFGFSGGETSLTAFHNNIFTYINTPYNLTMLQYFLITLVISYLACLGLALLIMFISSKSRNNLVVSTLGIIIFYLPLSFYAFYNGREELGGIINFTYGRMMQAAPLFDRFTGYVIFGNVIMLKELLLISLVAVPSAFSVLTYRAFRRHQAAN